jgi:pimeloyl-ACP methyl ester carboxylesterase
MPLPQRNSRIKLSQGQLFWREIGQGTEVVFLHGTWSDGSQWLPVMEQLSQKHHCFAPDLLGFGDSEHLNVHYSIALEVECLAEYLAALKLRQIYLVGHSVGAWVATSYALKYPEKVRGLVLLAPEGVQPERSPERWKVARWLVRKPPIFPWLLRMVYPIAKLFGATQGIKQLFQYRQKLQQSITACKLLFKRRRAEIKAELLQDQLSSLQIPVLLLQGEDSATEALSKAYAQFIPGIEVQFLSGHTETLPETASEAIAQQICEFIKKSAEH